MIDCIEETSQISLYDGVDPLLLDRATKSIQTSMLVTSWPIAITAAFEYGLVDRFQRSFDDGFYNLVLKSADA